VIIGEMAGIGNLKLNYEDSFLIKVSRCFLDNASVNLRNLWTNN